jgi:predicted permease
MLRLEIVAALRRWRAQPIFALGVVGVLGVSLAVTLVTTIVADALLVRPPVGNVPVDRLTDVSVSDYPTYREVRARVDAFDGVAAWFAPQRPRLLQMADGTRDVHLMAVSANLFDLIGVRPRIGRFFNESEDQPHGVHLAVISEHFWAETYARSDTALGKTIVLAGERYEISGVAPAGFAGPALATVDVFVPIAVAQVGLGPAALTDASIRWLHVLGRLRNGVGIARADGEVRAILPDSVTRAGNRNSKVVRPLMELRREQVGRASGITKVLLVVGFAILAIGCASAAGLFIGYDDRQREELAIKVALGAPPSLAQIVRVIEGVTLCVFSIVVSVTLANVILRGLVGGGLVDVATLDDGLDARMLGIVFLVFVVANVAILVQPLMRSRTVSHVRSAVTLRSAIRGIRSRTILLGAQVALTLPLTVSAVLFADSLRNALRLDLGMRLDNLIVGSTELRSVYTPADIPGRLDQLLLRLQAVPGVQAVAASDAGLGPGWITYSVRAPDATEMNFPDAVGFSAVTVGFVETIGMRLVSGRSFLASDRSQRAAIVNEQFARQRWGDAAALGRCIVLAPSDGACTTVIGVSADRKSGPGDARTVPEIFVPMGSPSVPAKLNELFPLGMVAVRVAHLDASVTAAVQSAMSEAFPSAPLVTARPAFAAYGALLRPWRLGSAIFGSFAVAAIAVACIGLYVNLLAALMDARHEIAIRVALGAPLGDTVRVLFRPVLRASAAGMLIGLCMSTVAINTIKSTLFGVSPFSPVWFVVGVSALGSTFLASALPFILHLTRLNPADVLKSV